MSQPRYTAAELLRLLSGSNAPIYVLDEDRRIVFCNAACAAATGLEAEQLIGQVCNYHSPAEAAPQEAIVAALCPPPEVFAGRPTSSLLRINRPDGQTICRDAHFFPLADGQDQSAEVLAVLGAAEADPRSFAELPELHEQVRRTRAALATHYRSEALLGSSPAIERVRQQIELAAAARASTLLIGPPGSGRRHAARAIHYRTSGATVLVPLDVALLDANLLRSSLRTMGDKPSSVDTLLLAHVDAASSEVQAELVELIDRSSSDARLRIVATAGQPLVALAAEGHFSVELAHRLSTITIELPPLASRPEDLSLLAQAFVEQLNAAGGKQASGFSQGALDHLMLYDWPGNLGELASVVSAAHAATTGPEITARDLPREIHWGVDAAAHPKRADESIVVGEFLARVELELITRALRRAKGNKAKAARLLGLTRPRLYRRLVQLGLESPEGDSQERPS